MCVVSTVGSTLLQLAAVTVTLTYGTDSIRNVCVSTGVIHLQFHHFPSGFFNFFFFFIQTIFIAILSCFHSSDGSLLAIASSYMYEQGEPPAGNQPEDAIYIRKVQEHEVKPK